MTHRTPPFAASSTPVRRTTCVMALAVTLGLLSSMGQIARHEVNSVETLLASAQPTQVVVITSQRTHSV
jgi:hypothetical protein